jgi:hypothetical protein
MLLGWSRGAMTVKLMVGVSFCEVGVDEGLDRAANVMRAVERMPRRRKRLEGRRVDDCLRLRDAERERVEGERKVKLESFRLNDDLRSC